MAQKKLEEYRYFPVVAWTLCISFALFVGHLALELRDTADNLQQTTLNLEQRMQSVEAMIRERPDAEQDHADTE